MSRTFRLAGLLRLRRMQEEQAAADLARANAERHAAAERRRTSESLLGGSTLPSVGDDLTWRAAVAGRAALTSLATESVAALELAGERVRQASDHWSDARTRATTLSKLEDRHEAEVRAEEERTEQLALDEVAGRRGTAGAAPLDAGPSTEGDR